MPTDQNTVQAPTLEQSTINLTDEGMEDMMRYAITSGELQRKLVSIVVRIQECEMDGCGYGELNTHGTEMERDLREIAALFNRMEKEARVVSSYHP